MIQERLGRGRKSNISEKTLTSICDDLDEETIDCSCPVRKVRYEYRSCLQSVDKAVKHVKGA